ncbi:MAG: hypothetical protein DRQ55_19285 [Planctomycetota bacterium]|nr:MAG: hypothetical protein DRQ55_19285 [Planctomycetota bacterium]
MIRHHDSVEIKPSERRAPGPALVGRIALGLLLLAPTLLLRSASAEDDPAPTPKAAPAEETEEAAGGAAGEDADPLAKTALTFEGSASFKTLGSLGQENFRFQLAIENAGDTPLTIGRADLLLAHLGGWLSPLDPDSLDGSFFRGPLLIPGGEVVPGLGNKYVSTTPATHALLTVRAEDGYALVPVPILHDGFEAPKAYAPPYPFGLGLVGPLHVVPFSDGEDAILLVGQHQVLNGGQPEEVETTIQIGNDAGATDPVTWKGLDSQGDLTALWPFVRRLPVFTGFESGSLRITSSARVKGQQETFTGTWPVTRIRPTQILTPVTGTWQLSNGPGGTDMTRRSAQTQDRYAYDMVVVKDGRTHKGDPHINSSYYAWNREIRAVADGIVVDVCDHEPDNPGYRGALTQCYNNRVVIKHPGDYYSVYLHIQQRSRKQGIRPNATVRAGQPLARVGNSGNSSEPHLHFQVYRIDATGRIRGVPVSFTNAFHDSAATKPVEGVPLSGQTYLFRRK